MEFHAKICKHISIKIFYCIHLWATEKSYFRKKSIGIFLQICCGIRSKKNFGKIKGGTTAIPKIKLQFPKNTIFTFSAQLSKKDQGFGVIVKVLLGTLKHACQMPFVKFYAKCLPMGRSKFFFKLVSKEVSRGLQGLTSKFQYTTHI